MAQRILGLDIGSHTIKAALFETSFRSYVLTDLFQSVPLRLDEAHVEEHDVIISEAILQLIRKNNLTGLTAVTAVAGKVTSNRVISFPLPRKQIPKVLPFEIENYIPFPMEDLIIDHHVIQFDKQGTICLAAAVQKEIIRRHLFLLDRGGVTPAFVTFDAIALYNLNQFINRGGTYAIVDLGHQKSSICIITDHKIGLVRTLFTGGRDVDEAIRSELNLTIDQAADVKEKHGMIDIDRNPAKTPDLKKLSTCIKSVIHPMFQEIFQSFQLFNAQEWIGPEQKIEEVYFCGGTSLIKNLPEYFTSLINIPAQRLYLLEHGSPDRPSRPREPVFANSVGIGLKVAARGKNATLIESINFRKGEFSFSKSLEDLEDKFLFAGKWAAVIFLLAFTHLILKYGSLVRENKRIEKIAVAEYKKVIADAPVKSSKEAVKKLETKIQELQQKQDVLTAGLDRTTALGILREISLLIPQDITVEMKEISIERNKIILRGETDSFASVDRMIASLQTKTDFARVEKGDLKDTSSGKKTFQMTILVGDAEVEGRS